MYFGCLWLLNGQIDCMFMIKHTHNVNNGSQPFNELYFIYLTMHALYMMSVHITTNTQNIEIHFILHFFSLVPIHSDFRKIFSARVINNNKYFENKKSILLLQAPIINMLSFGLIHYVHIHHMKKNAMK